MRPENCDDCQRPERGWGLDIVLIASDRRRIGLAGDIKLCPSCIAARAAKIPGATAIYATIEKEWNDHRHSHRGA